MNGGNRAVLRGRLGVMDQLVADRPFGVRPESKFSSGRLIAIAPCWQTDFLSHDGLLFVFRTVLQYFLLTEHFCIVCLLSKLACICQLQPAAVRQLDHILMLNVSHACFTSVLLSISANNNSSTVFLHSIRFLSSFIIVGLCTSKLVLKHPKSAWPGH